MSLFGRKSAPEQVPATPVNPLTEEGSDDAAAASIAGDRGIPSVNRARSIQSRVSSVLAIALMSTLGLGLLTWYYAKALSRPQEARRAAVASVKNHAQGEMALPSLGPITPPTMAHQDPSPAPAAATLADVPSMVGPAPELPPALGVPVAPIGVPQGNITPKSPGELALERRLAGPAFARSSEDGGGPSPVTSPTLEVASAGASQTRGAEEEMQDSSHGLSGLLRPSVTPAVAASVLPTRRLLLAKGAFIDCTLETAIDSTLPGMTTCVTATDTFSADGSVVLLERGTKLVGETRGQVQQGASRLFVLWTEARTPTGVVVPLSSPGTDELGRSGVAGEVNRHFWERFGAAILMTVINGTVQGIVNSQNSSGSVVVSPSTSTDVMSEVLRSTISIPPTITKSQGDRIQVFVARDVDFRPVYALRVSNAAAKQDGAQ